MRLLAFGTYDVRMHPRMAVILEGLRAHGDEVVEVDIPLGVSTAARVAMLRQPWRLPALAARLLLCWVRLVIRGRRVARRLSPDAVIVGYLGHFDVHLARLLFGRTPIALDQLVFAADTARDRGITGGWKSGLLRRLDHSAIAQADVVAVDTPEHQLLAFDHQADRAIVTPLGATMAWFNAGRDRRPSDPSRPLRVIFFGLFTPLQGTPVLGQALRLLADCRDLEVLVVGTGQDYAATRALAAMVPFVEWRDWVPSAELPSLVGQYDVCLGIFGCGPKAMHVVPNKVYQGAAAGCALVTSDTEPQRRTLQGAACFVEPGDALSLADHIRMLAGDRAQVQRLQAAARQLADGTFRPKTVVEPLRECLMSATESRRHAMSRR